MLLNYSILIKMLKMSIIWQKGLQTSKCGRKRGSRGQCFELCEDLQYHHKCFRICFSMPCRSWTMPQSFVNWKPTLLSFWDQTPPLLSMVFFHFSPITGRFLWLQTALFHLTTTGPLYNIVYKECVVVSPAPTG